MRTDGAPSVQEHQRARGTRSAVTGSTRSHNRVNWRDVEAELPALLEDLDKNERQIVRMRWLDSAERYDQLWRSHRLVFYGFRVPIIIGAATVPVLASLSVPKLATALVGLGVAILTGLDSFFRFGLRWQQQRHAAAEIESEGWGFLELSGPTYSHHGTHKAAYPEFLSRLEGMNRGFATSYLDLFREHQETPDKDGK
jgi:hypothetical protein